MKVNIIAVGKVKKEYQNIIDQFKKRIEFFSSLNIIEIKEFNDDNIEFQKAKETKRILESIPKNSNVFLLSLQGEQYTSKEFTEFFDTDNITFIIGGSHGVDESQFDKKISFSKMTLNHQLFRIFLVEQIYRAFSIKNNSKYHK